MWYKAVCIDLTTLKTRLIAKGRDWDTVLKECYCDREAEPALDKYEFFAWRVFCCHESCRTHKPKTLREIFAEEERYPRGELLLAKN